MSKMQDFTGYSENFDEQVKAIDLAIDTQLSGKNLFVNGDMRVAQRGTSFAAVANAAFTLDRYYWNQSSAASCTVSQVSEWNGNLCLKALVNSADASVAASDYAMISQNIEGYNSARLISNPFTLSFWVKSSKVGVYSVAFRNKATNRSYVAEYSILQANTWEKKEITVQSGLLNDGSFLIYNDTGLKVSFTLMAGSSSHTTAVNQWFNDAKTSSPLQVNLLDLANANFYIANIQLEVGESPTAFEQRPYSAELSLCQRYYETGYFYSTGYVGVAAGQGLSPIFFSTDKRIAPNVTFSGMTYANCSSASVPGAKPNCSWIQVTGTATSAAYAHGTYSAEAELL
jgi:hypothetical protein